MDNTIFVQSVSTIRFLETRLIDRTKIEAIVAASDFQDAMRLLQDSRYSEYLGTDSYEEGLRKAIEDMYRDMYKVTPVKSIVDIFAARYDGHNIKCLIKGKFSGVESDGLLINAGTIPADKLKAAVKEEIFRDFPAVLRKYVEMALEDYKNHGNPQSIDILIDKGVYEYMLELSGKSENEYVKGIVKTMIDIANIKAFIRSKIQEKGRELFERVFVPGGVIDRDTYLGSIGDSIENIPNRFSHTDHFKWLKPGIEEYIKSKDLGSIEKYSDNFLIDFARKAKLVSFGPEPMVAYILARENEIKILRIVLTGKKNEVSPGDIRERLRDAYV